jgi:hypothetical protein
MDEMNSEAPVYEIKRVKVKNGQLTADYAEKYLDANFSNEITKSPEQYVHSDLKRTFSLLKPHVAAVCEMPEAGSVDVSNPSDEDLNETLGKIIITGYSKGGSGDSKGVCIIAQRLLKTGQVLNITTPFTRFEDETGDGYRYGGELRQVIDRCDYEVDAYLFEGKWGMKQFSIDFDNPDGEASEEKPKKRGRKKKSTGEVYINNLKGDFSDMKEGEENIPDVEFEEIPA